MLGRLRLGPSNLRGRRFPEPSHPYRNDFQRDRDRIIHSRAFRRLEGKTQVFAVGSSDHFRNRLTHTIEVSQVARTLMVALHLNEEYAETLALAHDLGHPPFGHSGEKELDRQMRHFGSSFEHNSHALRIVDLLEERYARFEGLNLTFEVREGILKHSRELWWTEDPVLLELLPGVRPPLEAQLLDLADEIAYNTADVDDAFWGGLLALEDIGAAVPIYAELAETVDTQFPGATPRVRFWEVERQIINILIGGLIEGTVAAAEAAQLQSVEDVRALDRRVAMMTPESAAINRQLKGLLVSHVYCNEQLAGERAQAVVKVGQLFEFLLQYPKHMPAGHRDALAFTPLHRVVCDFMAGMTDAYFLRTYDTLIRQPTHA
jgi:dGTPase